MVRTFSFPLTALLLVACAGHNGAAPTGTAATSASAPAQPGVPLTQQEREKLTQNLEATRQAFLSSVKGLSDAQFRFKPAPDRWSIAEVAEHIVVAEERIYGMVTEKIAHTPTPPELLAQVQHDDARLSTMVTDRSHKIQAPEMLKPTGRFPNLDSVVTAFGQVRDKTEAYEQTTQDDLRAHAMPHPVLKALDGYQWLLLVSAHCARHTAQIEEVKASPNFPRT